MVALIKYVVAQSVEAITAIMQILKHSMSLLHLSAGILAHSSSANSPQLSQTSLFLILLEDL